MSASRGRDDLHRRVDEDLGEQSNPLLVTGAHRTGTTWVGKMLALSGEFGYIDEPFRKRSNRGINERPFPTWYPYISRDAGGADEIRQALQRTLDFKFGFLRGLSSLR